MWSSVKTSVVILIDKVMIVIAGLSTGDSQYVYR